MGRVKLPRVREGVDHEVVIFTEGGPVSVNITVGIYESGRIGEVFITVSKWGSTLGGLCDTIALLLSHALQYGGDVEDIAEALKHRDFEPRGRTDNPDIPICTSIPNYLGQYLTWLTTGTTTTTIG